MTITVRMTAFPGTYPSDETSPVVGQVVIPVNSLKPIHEILHTEFLDAYPEWATRKTPGEPDLPYPFALFVSDSEAVPLCLNDLEPVFLWEGSDGKVQVPGLGCIAGHLSASDILRTYRAGYLKTSPLVVYAAPLQGIGAGGTDLIWLLSELFFFGAAWVASDALPSPKTWLREASLTKRARSLSEDFTSRGIRYTEDIRRWAETRQQWTTHEGARKLGVDYDIMESIFSALGYKQRFEDQTWELGLTEEYCQRRQAWIDGEPQRRAVSTGKPLKQPESGNEG